MKCQGKEEEGKRKKERGKKKKEKGIRKGKEKAKGNGYNTRDQFIIFSQQGCTFNYEYQQRNVFKLVAFYVMPRGLDFLFHIYYEINRFVVGTKYFLIE